MATAQGESWGSWVCVMNQGQESHVEMQMWSPRDHFNHSVTIQEETHVMRAWGGGGLDTWQWSKASQMALSSCDGSAVPSKGV